MREGGALRKHSFCCFSQSPLFSPENERTGGGGVGVFSWRGSETTYVTLLSIKLLWVFGLCVNTFPFEKLQKCNLKNEWTAAECYCHIRYLLFGLWRWMRRGNFWVPLHFAYITSVRTPLVTLADLARHTHVSHLVLFIAASKNSSNKH